MDDFISREAAIKEIKAHICFTCPFKSYSCTPEKCGTNAALKAISEIPAADVRPVVRGKWKHDGSDWKNRFICDQCGYKWFFEAEEAHFCPNCGYAMENEK